MKGSQPRTDATQPATLPLAFLLPCVESRAHPIAPGFRVGFLFAEEGVCASFLMTLHQNRSCPVNLAFLPVCY